MAVGLLLLTYGPLAVARADAGAGRGHEVPTVQPLPELIEPVLPEPSPAELGQLDAFVARLLAPEAALRTEALGHVRDADTSWLPAIAERFESLASSANKPAMKVLLDTVRARARERVTDPEPLPTLRKAPRKKPTEPPRTPTVDSLETLVAHPDRSSAFLRPLTEVLAYARMFEAIGTLPAARRLVSVYERFGEFLRVDTELALARMQDGAVAALIEASGHPVPRVAEWAKKRLDVMGKLVASEAVQVQDATLRADILRAYGKTRDVETARLLISFAASERSLVRLAARQAVSMLGEAGLWQLRDAYEKTVGERAPREWSWQRVAEELFAQFDRQRLAELYRLFNQGRDAAQRGDLAGARELFDQVLAWDPRFERGASMAPVYIAFAESQLDADPEAATLALRRAERLAPSGPEHDRALSLRYTLDARALVERGIVDEVLVQRARELDPKNARAAALEAELQQRSRGDRATFQRVVAAAVILMLALVALGVIALRGSKRNNRQDAKSAKNFF
jgi:hypothetical protein